MRNRSTNCPVVGSTCWLFGSFNSKPDQVHPVTWKSYAKTGPNQRTSQSKELPWAAFIPLKKSYLPTPETSPSTYQSFVSTNLEQNSQQLADFGNGLSHPKWVKPSHQIPITPDSTIFTSVEEVASECLPLLSETLQL